MVSGPNAGGKSVALKTVGVFCLLAQCGWDVPAREDTRLPLVGRVLADLGDDQSIAESLSSFSAHLRHLARFLREAGPDTLVLCDEIGSGTDPHEGTALAFGVLEDLAQQGALVLASTHFGLLKAAVHDHPLMVNAAMDYDDRDLQAPVHLPGGRSRHQPRLRHRGAHGAAGGAAGPRPGHGRRGARAGRKAAGGPGPPRAGSWPTPSCARGRPRLSRSC